MSDGGKIIIETKNLEIDEIYASQHQYVVPGPYVMLTVTDTGEGIPEKIKSKIFEPLFTTKEQGKGTGLGLATAYGVIKQSGGSMEVYSEQGKGAAFKIYLPQVTGEIVSKESQPAKIPVEKGYETILLVEDDPGIRKLSTKLLEHNGYKVMEASRASEALHICQTHQGPIDLVLTDVIMPEMDGPKMAHKIQELRPHIPIMYMSGYTHGLLTTQNILDPSAVLIQKPFTSVSLLYEIKRLLHPEMSLKN